MLAETEISARPISRPLSEIAAARIEWLWKGRIPIGCITLLEGDGGIGKSFVVSSLGSAISSGQALPDDTPKAPARVLLLAAEDDPGVVLRPRFESHGADLENVFIFNQDLLLDESGFQTLRLEIARLVPKLIVIDPVVSFLGTRLDASKATDVRSVMKPLHELASSHRCAVLVVRHWNKASQSSAAHRGSGSVDFRNAARSVLQVIKTPEERFVTVEKSNYGEEGRTLKFVIENGALKWTGLSEMKADDILAGLRTSSSGGSQLEAAKRFLERALANGPLPSPELFRQARENGISDPTLNRAKQLIPIRSMKKGKGWMWGLEAANVRRFYQDTQDDHPIQPLLNAASDSSS